jgi:hypothetical protein
MIVLGTEREEREKDGKPGEDDIMNSTQIDSLKKGTVVDLERI